MKRLEQIEDAYTQARGYLLNQIEGVHWTGELSASALSTATAVMAFAQYHQALGHVVPAYQELIERGLGWLASHQNSDGGWGDTIQSQSNISTTMLCQASLEFAGEGRFEQVKQKGRAYIDRAGGIPAVRARYGKDHTFSVPILTHVALAGGCEFRELPALPFELALLPHSFFRTIELPVVSYALPALIAIGQIQAKRAPSPYLPLRWLRQYAQWPTLKKLAKIQPESGGFLEATPLTSFVCMSLAHLDTNNEVLQKGLGFLARSIRPEGSWPIDTNLATWTTTLSVNALGKDLPEQFREPIWNWLIGQQYHELHPYTNAAPGGWAWTDLPGGVPDADDTPGALLALLSLAGDRTWMKPAQLREFDRAIACGVRWLLDLQNRDGGWPTFCRGWGALPFDRSAADITAHVIRALRSVIGSPHTKIALMAHRNRIPSALERGFRYLKKKQRQDGSWLPLWFGNQGIPDDENPLYGTAKVLLAYEDASQSEERNRGIRWVLANAHPDGGWGGNHSVPPSIEETSLALECLTKGALQQGELQRGIDWLIQQISGGGLDNASPIGFYFAKLWYFEKLYPPIFAVGALNRIRECLYASDAS